MATIAEMEAWRDQLIRDRSRGVTTVSYDGQSVTYKSDRDFASAIADLERRISNAKSGGRRGGLYIKTSKGV